MGTDPGVGSQSQGLVQDGHMNPARLRRVWRLPKSLAKGLSLPSGVAPSMAWKLGQLVAIYHHSGGAYSLDHREGDKGGRQSWEERGLEFRHPHLK